MTRRVKGIQYALVQTARKNMEIRVLSSGEVRVFVPKGTRLRDADAFVSSRVAWITDAIDSMRRYAEKREREHPMADGSQVLIEGKLCSLRVAQAEKAELSFDGETLRARLPETDEAHVREAVRRFLIERATGRIAERLAYYEPQTGRRPSRVTIREQKTRWGSCSRAGNINLNWKLIMAPPEALDYVVIHELCHLYEFNHSTQFWKLVAKIQPGYETWKKWLKQNGRILGV
ncbi:MAG: M48 family metallopeptidase [Christensenellales bacterium]